MSCDLLLWKNPVETGKVFGGLLCALLVLKKVNLITFLLRVIYTVIFTTATLEFLSKLFLSQGLVTKYGLQDCPNIVGFLKPKIDEILKKLPVYQAKFRKLVMASSPERSYKAAGVVYILHKLFLVFSLWTLLLLSIIGIFTLPLIYKTYQNEIDECLCQVFRFTKDKSQSFSKVACDKATPYVRQLDEQLSPISSFIASKFPQVRTAGSTVSPESTTTFLAAKVPVEVESVATTTSASFPSVPDAATVDVGIEELEQSEDLG